MARSFYSSAYVLRIANPGSDLTTFAGVFRELYSALHNLRSFDLDDMSKVLVGSRLMTSSGYIGPEALERGYRKNRSLDAPFNQSKMYSELLRMLGWIHPSYNSRQTFRFTLLGAHAAHARIDRTTILDESLLGVAFPSPFLEAKAQVKLRPFAAILRAMGDLDGLITRDEIILGPLSLTHDRDRKNWATMIALIRSTRGEKKLLEARLNAISDEEGITRVTMTNYTRFPVAAPISVGWADRVVRNDIYGRGVPFLRLTEHGVFTLKRLSSLTDVRSTDLTKFPDDVRKAITVLGFYQMLERAGFDTTSVASQMIAAKKTLQVAGHDLGGGLLFSPFQELTLAQMAPVFEDISGTTVKTSVAEKRTERGRQIAQARLSPLVTATGQVGATEEIATVIVGLSKKGAPAKRIADMLHAQYSHANRDVFYPLIVSLFRILGFPCELSRQGVNYERCDALIPDKRSSIPIEIKSPGEEARISVKGVRQALENKVILLARKQWPTTRDTTSLLVGYELPNDRAEVAALVNDILVAFDIRIAVCDLRSLLLLAVAKLIHGVSPEHEEFTHLSGILRVADPS